MSLEVTKRGTVAVLTMQRRDAMNSFDPPTIKALRETVEALQADDEVRALVLTGSGRAFSTGADVKAMQQAAAQATGRAWVLAATAELHPLLLRLHRGPKPFIAAVNGVAAGGGLGLALAADARIGTRDARFAAGYFGIGLSPDGGSTWLLPRLIGTTRTHRFFFENEVMDCDEALRLGLLDQIVEPEALVEEAVGLASRWGAWAAASRAGTRDLLGMTWNHDLATQLDVERQRIAEAASRPDFAAGTAAFVAKRPARFD